VFRWKNEKFPLSKSEFAVEQQLDDTMQQQALIVVAQESVYAVEIDACFKDIALNDASEP
jgi:hypothetical protein